MIIMMGRTEYFLLKLWKMVEMALGASKVLGNCDRASPSSNLTCIYPIS
jgi:hypothetical protein